MLESLLKRPLVASLFRNSAWILADKGLRILVGMFVTAKMARMLGPQGFGTIHYALSIASLFAIFGSLGLESILNRDISRQRNREDQVLGTAFMMKLIAAILGYLSVIVFSVLAVDPELQSLVLIAASGLFFMAFDISEVYFHSHLLSSRVVWVRSALFILASVLRILFLHQEYPVSAFLFVSVLEVGVGSLILFAYFKISRGKTHRLNWNSAIAKTLFQQSIPMIAFGLGSAYLIRADSLFIQRQLGESAVGIYSIAVRLTEIFYILPMALVGSSLPALAMSFGTQDGVFAKRSNELLKGLSLLGWALSLFIFSLAPQIISILFGAGYLESVSILRIYALALPFVFSGAVRNTIWIAQGKPGKIGMTTLASCVIATFIYAFIAGSDLTNYAWGFLISNLICYWIFTAAFDFPLFWLQTKKLLPFPTKMMRKSN